MSKHHRRHSRVDGEWSVPGRRQRERQYLPRMLLRDGAEIDDDDDDADESIEFGSFLRLMVRLLPSRPSHPSAWSDTRTYSTADERRTFIRWCERSGIALEPIPDSWCYVATISRDLAPALERWRCVDTVEAIVRARLPHAGSGQGEVTPRVASVIRKIKRAKEDPVHADLSLYGVHRSDRREPDGMNIVRSTERKTQWSMAEWLTAIDGAVAAGAIDLTDDGMTLRRLQYLYTLAPAPAVAIALIREFGLPLALTNLIGQRERQRQELERIDALRRADQLEYARRRPVEPCDTVPSPEPSAPLLGASRSERDAYIRRWLRRRFRGLRD